MVVVVILFCLFPLAPQPIKLAVVYLSMTLLILIAVVITVRTLIAAVSWIALGRALWLFPHLLAEASHCCCLLATSGTTKESKLGLHFVTVWLG